MANEYHKEVEFIKESLPGWKALKEEQIEFSRCSFGNSRITFKVTSTDKSISPNPIILRKFTSKTGSSLANDTKSFAQMSDAKVGPHQYILDENLGYRIEQYIESRMLLCNEINQKLFRRKLAIKLASIHNLPPQVEDKPRAYIFKAMDEWTKPAKDHSDPSIYKDEVDKVIAKNVAYLFSDDETAFVRKEIESRKLIWSHNDIWTGNILVTIPENDVFIIDYEVINYNFEGYDIGKLMLEVLYERDPHQPTYTFKSFEHLPSKDDIFDFLKCYFLTRSKIPIQNLNDDSEIESLFKQLHEKEEERTQILETAFKEVEFGMMISGYYSALLGMWIGKNPNMTMDFLQFGKDGAAAYEFFKRKLY